MEYNWKIQSVVSPDLLPPFKVFRKRNRKVIERKLLPICGNVFTSEGAGSLSHSSLFQQTTKLRNNLCQNVRIFSCQEGNKGNIPFA